MPPFFSRTSLYLSLLLASLALGGCALLYAATGKGQQPALFKFGKDQKVLVLVDVDDNVAPPPAFPTNLADKISSHLFRYKATDHVIPQERLIDLEQSNPAKFKAMGVADVAVATGADVVVTINLKHLDIHLSLDGNVADGAAEATVKVINQKGERLYPGDAAGNFIRVEVDSDYVSDRDVPTLQKKLLDKLATHAGRIFHDYDLEDKDMIDGVEDRKVIGR